MPSAPCVVSFSNADGFAIWSKADRNNQKLLIDHSDVARDHAIDAPSYALWQGVKRAGNAGLMADSSLC